MVLWNLHLAVSGCHPRLSIHIYIRDGDAVVLYGLAIESGESSTSCCSTDVSKTY